MVVAMSRSPPQARSRPQHRTALGLPVRRWRQPAALVGVRRRRDTARCSDGARIWGEALGADHPVQTAAGGVRPAFKVLTMPPSWSFRTQPRSLLKGLALQHNGDFGLSACKEISAINPVPVNLCRGSRRRARTRVHMIMHMGRTKGQRFGRVKGVENPGAGGQTPGHRARGLEESPPGASRDGAFGFSVKEIC